MKRVRTVMRDSFCLFCVRLLIMWHAVHIRKSFLKQFVLFEQGKVIKKDDPVIKLIALAWRCKSLVP